MSTRWISDNPQVNSQENKENVSNPLFTFALKLIPTGPDCTDSANCGLTMRVSQKYSLPFS